MAVKERAHSPVDWVSNHGEKLAIPALIQQSVSVECGANDEKSGWGARQVNNVTATFMLHVTIGYGRQGVTKALNMAFDRQATVKS